MTKAMTLHDEMLEALKTISRWSGVIQVNVRFESEHKQNGVLAALDEVDKAISRAQAEKAAEPTLREALEGLHKAGKEVSDRGATPGPHFTRLTMALLKANSALSKAAPTED
ncbi:hypothetical protein HBA54_19210 [Pelagibius litoralis]|uniref:Uncharacterized protein n=1 Tax=Pelagibius litoralis TaxID=374515 RepID=A0A967F0C5_9PROT|nr:hypothetical protein [Pelagibius litoralis]NIA70732.1 hypothetical protein [Pelagibius litoralis]